MSGRILESYTVGSVLYRHLRLILRIFQDVTNTKRTLAFCNFACKLSKIDISATSKKMLVVLAILILFLILWDEHCTFAGFKGILRANHVSTACIHSHRLYTIGIRSVGS